VDALVTGLVDYAGLFPPASLDMAAAVQTYHAFQADSCVRLLSRFIVPATRLTELERATAPILTGSRSGFPWRLAALAGPDVTDDVERVIRFNAAQSQLSDRVAVVDAIEAKATTIDDIAAIHALVPPGLDLYVEVPARPDPTLLVADLARRGARAKIRTGGITPDAIPHPRDVARFMIAAARADLPFKATAGLHHAFRGTYPLTYATDSPRATMHGFINVFMGAVLARTGGSEDQVTMLLEETESSTIVFGSGEVQWHGSEFTIQQLHDTRDNFALSFGSCSLREPVEELRALGLL
jgi:hypothetical protein